MTAPDTPGASAPMPGSITLLAFIAFASALFARAVDPVIPQIAHGLNVAPTTAALLSSGYTLPFALIQPLLGALADMMSKSRLIIVSVLLVSARASPAAWPSISRCCLPHASWRGSPPAASSRS